MVAGLVLGLTAVALGAIALAAGDEAASPAVAEWPAGVPDLAGTYFMSDPRRGTCLLTIEPSGRFRLACDLGTARGVRSREGRARLREGVLVLAEGDTEEERLPGQAIEGGPTPPGGRPGPGLDAPGGLAAERIARAGMRRPDSLFPLRFGDRVYLVPTREVLEFCIQVEEKREPRRERRGRFYLRTGDEERPVPDGVKPRVCLPE